jgi:hypothetical protein
MTQIYLLPFRVLSLLPTMGFFTTPVVAAAASLLLLTSSSTAQEADCFSNTSSILLAQMQDPPILDIVLCSDTIFRIGVPTNPELVFSAYEKGDIPLTAIHDNMVFSCGNSTNPTSENICILDGGWIQFLTQPTIVAAENPISTHNLTVRGLTFTGNLTQATNTDGSVASSHAISLNAPGENMVLDDCLFLDLSADSVISNRWNELMSSEEADSSLYPPYSSTLTLQNSLFQNVVYKWHAVHNYQQSMILSQVRFDNVQFLPLLDNGTNSTTDEFPSTVISIVNGLTDVLDCTFSNIQVLTSVVHVWDLVGSLIDLVGVQGNMATSDVLVIDTEGKDPSTYCRGGLMVEMMMAGANSTVDCLQLFEYAPTIAPTADQCFGICGLEGTLINPETQVFIEGPSGENLTIACEELNNGLTFLPPPYDTGACPAGARAAQLMGCECEGVPTAAPVFPTPRPTLVPTISAEPTRSRGEVETTSPSSSPTSSSTEVDDRASATSISNLSNWGMAVTALTLCLGL